MPLLTPRLTLRFFTPEDFQPLRRLDSDPQVLRYRSRSIISPEETQTFLEQAQSALQDSPRRLYAYAVTRRTDGIFLGQCGMTATTSEAKECFLWYSLLREHWGQAYMPEAVGALVWMGFTHFALQCIFAESHPDNHASIRVMEKVGLQNLGSFWIPDSQRKPRLRVRYRLMADEYAPKKIDGIEILPPV